MGTGLKRGSEAKKERVDGPVRSSLLLSYEGQLAQE